MKNLITIIAGLIAVTASYGANFALNGFAIQGSPSLTAAGDTAVWVTSGTSSFDVAVFEDLAADISFTVGGLIGGYEIAGINSTVGAGPFFLQGINPFTADAVAGDRFGVIVFSTSTTSTLVSDTYSVFTDASWVLPAPGGSITFGQSGQPITITGAGVGGTVAVPEPSAFALLAGCFGLGWVMLRRRAS